MRSSTNHWRAMFAWYSWNKSPTSVLLIVWNSIDFLHRTWCYRVLRPSDDFAHFRDCRPEFAHFRNFAMRSPDKKNYTHESHQKWAHLPYIIIRGKKVEFVRTSRIVYGKYANRLPARCCHLTTSHVSLFRVSAGRARAPLRLSLICVRSGRGCEQ